MPVVIDEMTTSQNGASTEGPKFLRGNFTILLDGSPAPTEMQVDILDITVENSLHLPDLCTIRLHCWDDKKMEFKWLDDDTLAVGKKIEIQAGYDADMPSIFFGEITGLDIDYSALGTSTVQVRALDKSHRLHRGRHSRSFVQQKDSDLVSKLAAESGLSVGEIEESSGVYDWVFQNNQTNSEFLQARARRIGYRMYVEGDGLLYFKKVTDSESDSVPVTWGNDLRSFRPRLSAGLQVDKVTVRGWDPKTKQAIVGTAERAQGVPQIGVSTQGGDVAKEAFGDSEMTITDQTVTTQDQASQMAQSVLDDISGEYMEGDGLCDGKPDLMPGKMIEIDNIGMKYSGKYLVSATTHVYSPSEGYTTLFSINGKRPANLLSILDDENGGARADMGGNIVVGVVTDNNDPDNLCRVKVKYPWLSEDDTSFWARLVTPMAGPGRGFEFIPEVDDEVLVAFEHGDIHRPYVLGALWNGVDAPPLPSNKAVKNNKVIHRRIRTRTGHILDFNDQGVVTLLTAGGHKLMMTDGKEGAIRLTCSTGHKLVLHNNNQAYMETKNGHAFFLDDEKNQLWMVDSKHKNGITILSDEDKILLKCDGDMKLEAGGNMNLEVDGDFHLSAGNVTIEAQQIIKAQASSQIQLGSQAGTFLGNGSEPVVLQGSAIFQNSPGPPPVPPPPKPPDQPVTPSSTNPGDGGTVDAPDAGGSPDGGED